ncbi:radical SAM protein [Eubacterium multiforme]|uniref:DNA repair photolyase n=1 Tax=Eubacterium multiforme TaxID=83339 RepID=A0ABT9UTL5_9FIRM|nr:radical SAM protein [Eubacterium multiforme]MDQ0149659.1 DNA repair photolyase [Eubacterium multiforme]
MNKQNIIFKKCEDDNIKIRPHCNSKFCNQKILEVNPAIGCEFQCQYCCVYTQEEENKFSKIIVYEDYADMLEKYIQDNIDVVKDYYFFLSFESDCFQDILISTGITSSILEIFLKYNLKYFILTKGKLPNSQIKDLLIKTKKFGQVIVNDTMPDEKYRAILEPNTATLEERYNLVKFCLDNDIYTTISFSPIFPFENIDYIKRKIDMYSRIGINHFRLDMLELSFDSYNKVLNLIPECREHFNNLYMDKNSTENIWKVPNENKRIKRYKPNEEYMFNIYNDIKQYIKCLDNNITVSICDGVALTNVLLKNFNREAYDNGINCMGINLRK